MAAGERREGDWGATRLAAARMSADRATPVTEFLLIPMGEVRVERPIAGASFVFTPRHAASAKRWFDALGRKLAIDYEHQSLSRGSGRADGLRPAAGWIGGLDVREDGLWAVDVHWTERAAALLASGEYRYFSPVIYWTDDEHSDVSGLGPVALTNDPAMLGVPALASARAGADEPGCDGDGRIDALPADGAATARGAAVESVLRGKLELARREIALLRREMAARDADAFVERGMGLGKILDSTSMDWRDDYLRDAEVAESRLARAPVLLPPGRQVTHSAGSDGSRSASGALSGGCATERADIEAFERAMAAGRVRLR